jgi:hypothetical protein
MLLSTKIHGVISNEIVVLTTTFLLIWNYTTCEVETMSLNIQWISQSTNIREEIAFSHVTSTCGERRSLMKGGESLDQLSFFLVRVSQITCRNSMMIIIIIIIIIIITIINIGKISSLRSAFFWDFKQRRMVVSYDVSRPIGHIFKGQGLLDPWRWDR